MYFRTMLAASAVFYFGVISVSSSSPQLPTSSAPQFPSSSAPQFLSSPATSHLRSSGASAGKQSSDTANLYRINCQMCHGPSGKALIPEMAFVGRKWKHGTKSADMVKIIAEGVKGTPMLPFKAKLNKTQIQALARYVRAFDKTLPPEK